MSKPLIHLLQWAQYEGGIDFKLRRIKVKKGDDEYEHVTNMSINNVTYRPVGSS